MVRVTAEVHQTVFLPVTPETVLCVQVIAAPLHLCEEGSPMAELFKDGRVVISMICIPSQVKRRQRKTNNIETLPFWHSSRSLWPPRSWQGYFSLLPKSGADESNVKARSILF